MIDDLLRVGRDADQGEAMRRLLQAALQDLVDAEATARIGAGRYERNTDRVTHHNGRVVSQAVVIVVSDAHEGLKTAVKAILPGAAWQRSLVNIEVAGSSRWFILTVGRGPWQRDLRGPAADLSLPAVADSDWLVGVVPRQREHLSERPEEFVTRRTRLRRRSAHARPQRTGLAGVRRRRLGR